MSVPIVATEIVDMSPITDPIPIVVTGVERHGSVVGVTFYVSSMTSSVHHPIRINPLLVGPKHNVPSGSILPLAQTIVENDVWRPYGERI